MKLYRKTGVSGGVHYLMHKKIYRQLPSFAQRPVRQIYQKVSQPQTDVSDDFKKEFFKDGEYENYKNEFYESDIPDIISSKKTEYQEKTGNSSLAGHSLEGLAAYFALIRKKKPSVVVETGVAHGTSTLSILFALEKNSNGVLHSIDFPFQADNGTNLEESHSSFLENKIGLDTFYPFEKSSIRIPDGNEPGWIVPSHLRHRWEFHRGLSQRKLPEVCIETEKIDIFLHDSDHSIVCQLFEYDLAWAWLDDGGVLISDDISEAFERFVETRTIEQHGEITDGTGFIK